MSMSIRVEEQIESTFVTGAMLPQYAGQDVILAGKITDLGPKTCKMVTTDNVNVNVIVSSSEGLELGFYEVDAKVMSATTIKAINLEYFRNGDTEKNTEMYHTLCKSFQMIPDTYAVSNKGDGDSNY